MSGSDSAPPRVESSLKSGVLRLVRLPRLVTVWGEPFAGAALAGAPIETEPILSAVKLLLVLLALSLFYLSGMALNDVADFKKDRLFRPHRPIVEGAISLNLSLKIGLGLMGAGLLLAIILSLIFSGWISVAAALGLAVSILLYNFALKNIPALGSLCMGACRGFALLFAGTLWLSFPETNALPDAMLPLLFASGISFLYVSTLTALSRTEDETFRPANIAFFAILSLLIASTALFPLRDKIQATPPLVLQWALVIYALFRVLKEKAKVFRVTKSLVIGVPLLMSAFCLGSGQIAFGVFCALLPLFGQAIERKVPGN